MPKRKNEQTLADKAYKKARDDEIGRFLEGCLKNYKEGKSKLLQRSPVVDVSTPPLFRDSPRQDVELAAGSYFTPKPKSSRVGERELLPLTPRHVPGWGARATTHPDGT